MLPAHRTAGEGFSIPQFDLTPCDVDGFLDELQAFHDQFRGCFARSEPREHFCHYMVGQFSARARKSIEPMALQVQGGNMRGMQRCMSDDVWDEDTMRQTYHGLVAHEMGEPDGVLIVDESGFIKKGQDSVGVARQYCGTLGKVDNGQVGVFAAYASRHGYALVDKRLFLLEQWFSDGYAMVRMAPFRVVDQRSSVCRGAPLPDYGISRKAEVHGSFALCPGAISLECGIARPRQIR